MIFSGFTGPQVLPKTQEQIQRDLELKRVEESWVKCSTLATKKENIGTIIVCDDCYLYKFLV